MPLPVQVFNLQVTSRGRRPLRAPAAGPEPRPRPAVRPARPAPSRPQRPRASALAGPPALTLFLPAAASQLCVRVGGCRESGQNEG